MSQKDPKLVIKLRAYDSHALKCAALAAAMIWMKRWNSAVFLLVVYDLIIRPSEGYAVLHDDVVPPVASCGMRNWVFIIAPQERGSMEK